MILASSHVLPPRSLTFANWTSIKDSPLPSSLVIGIFNHGLTSFGLMNFPSNWARRLISIQTTLAIVLQLHGQCTFYLDSRLHCDDGRWRLNIKPMAGHQSDRQAALASPLPRPQSDQECLESFENTCNKTSPAPHNGQLTCGHSERLG
ncbi:hypothetical protein O181_002675 [Austropuccinia psidii MF-1]|uniref:Uncharacterized protein n=1 Tax=Austropuccinia psidii MF-1 TaxID=1389203 RepID=A0A9Q3BDG8_9BASI|nr:hypothetical protein [Austropuccinia psidii MF-1]